MRVLEPGDVIDQRFQLIEMIGQGGMGIVFHALELATGQHVALKTLSPRLSNKRNARARFVQEAVTMRQLKSRHTVSVFELGEEGETIYYTMELLHGESLESLIERQGCLQADLTMAITTQILQSLTEAHALGVIHRDLTPSNIHLCRRTRNPFFVKVLDFGLAKQLGGQGPHNHLTNSGMALGTLPYMAPEQLRRRPLSSSTDLYTVGHLIYEMLAGHNIYRGMRNSDIIDCKVHGRLPDKLGAPLSHPFGAVITKALQSDPNMRYKSADQMRQHMAIIGRLMPRTGNSNAKTPPRRQSCSVIPRTPTRELPVSPRSHRTRSTSPIASVAHRTLPRRAITGA